MATPLDLRHDDEAFGGVAIDLELPGHKVMGRKGAESGIDQVDVGERIDGEPYLTKQSGTVGALLFGGQNLSRQRVCHGVRKGLETHRTACRVFPVEELVLWREEAEQLSPVAHPTIKLMAFPY